MDESEGEAGEAVGHVDPYATDTDSEDSDDGAEQESKVKSWVQRVSVKGALGQYGTSMRQSSRRSSRRNPTAVVEPIYKTSSDPIYKTGNVAVDTHYVKFPDKSPPTAPGPSSGRRINNVPEEEEVYDEVVSDGHPERSQPLPAPPIPPRPSEGGAAVPTEDDLGELDEHYDVVDVQTGSFARQGTLPAVPTRDAERNARGKRLSSKLPPIPQNHHPARAKRLSSKLPPLPGGGPRQSPPAAEYETGPDASGFEGRARCETDGLYASIDEGSATSGDSHEPAATSMALDEEPLDEEESVPPPLFPRATHTVVHDEPTPTPTFRGSRGDNSIVERLRGLEGLVAGMCDSLIRKGSVVKCNVGSNDDGTLRIRTRQNRIMFLFDGCLLICKESYGVWYARGQYPRQAYNIEDLPQSEAGVGFKIYSSKKNKWYIILMKGPQPEVEKKAWMDAFQEAQICQVEGGTRVDSADGAKWSNILNLSLMSESERVDLLSKVRRGDLSITEAVARIEITPEFEGGPDDVPLERNPDFRPRSSASVSSRDSTQAGHKLSVDSVRPVDPRGRLSIDSRSSARDPFSPVGRATSIHLDACTIADFQGSNSVEDSKGYVELKRCLVMEFGDAEVERYASEVRELVDEALARSGSTSVSEGDKDASASDGIFLVKKAFKRGKERRRWFELYPTALRYFSTMKVNNGVPEGVGWKGIVPITDSTIVTSNGLTIMIENPDRVWELVADAAGDATRWCQKIDNAKRAIIRAQLDAEADNMMMNPLFKKESSQ